MIKIGQRVRFDPFACLTAFETVEEKKTTTGRVVMVNEKHGWFSVEYQLGGTFRISFMISQIGKAVKFCD